MWGNVAYNAGTDGRTDGWKDGRTNRQHINAANLSG